MKLTKPNSLRETKRKNQNRLQKTEANETQEEEEHAPVLLADQVNNNLHSSFKNIEMYFNNQQNYTFDGLYAHKLYNFNNFEGAIFDYKGVLNCEVYDFEDFLNDIIESHFSDLLCTR